jgi:hypothetical protein
MDVPDIEAGCVLLRSSEKFVAAVKKYHLSLQWVVDEQGVAPSLMQASVASTQDPLPSQPIVAFY